MTAYRVTGKRYNVLRDRVDDWDYDLDQLLLGAMLLTLINFLFPTVTVYYILFALVSPKVRKSNRTQVKHDYRQDSGCKYSRPD